MNKKNVAICLAAIALAVSLFTLMKPAATTNANTLPEKSSAQQRKTIIVPDWAVFDLLFRDVNLRRRTAEKAEASGDHRVATSWRTTYKRKAELSDEQAQTLESIAAECEQETQKIDAQAKPIIARERARYLSTPKGQPVPPLPPELGQLQNERNLTILRCRDKLQAAFGDQEYARFYDFLKRDFAPNITVNNPQPQK